MEDLTVYQYLLIGLIFVWSGLVRSGLGFGGAVLTLPFLLLVVNDPLVFLPIISLQLLFFASITLYQAHKNTQKTPHSTTIDWRQLQKTLPLILPAKLAGVLGLITLPVDILSLIIFCMIGGYALTYLFDVQLKSETRWLDRLFLVFGGYMSGISLVGGPLILAVYGKALPKAQLRDTVFVLWVVLVAIKTLSFLYVGIDLQLQHQLWLLPCGAIGHLLGLRLHTYLLQGDSRLLYRVIGLVLSFVSLVGILRIVL